MKNQALWIPTKFVDSNSKLQANSDQNIVAISSRLNVELLGIALKKLLLEYANGHILDLGCGAVPLFAQYNSLVDQITCVDWTNSAHGNNYVDIVADLNAPIPIDSAFCDTVLLTDVLEHIAEPGALLAEIFRMLRVDGVLIGSVPFLYRLHEEPHDHYRYTIHALRRLAEMSGFAVEVLEPYGAGTDVLFDILGKLLQPLHWRFGPKLASWSQILGIKIRRTAYCRKINGYNQSMPLGYVFVFKKVPD